MATPIGTLGTIDTITVGGRVFTDLTTLKVLRGYSTSTKEFTFRNGASGYQASNTLTLYALRMFNGVGASATSVIGNCTLAYSDNNVGLDATGGTFTNPVYYGGSSSLLTLGAGNVVGLNMTEASVNFAVPTTKYPGAVCNSAASYLTAFGYDV